MFLLRGWENHSVRARPYPPNTTTRDNKSVRVHIHPSRSQRGAPEGGLASAETGGKFCDPVVGPRMQLRAISEGL